MSPNHWHLVRVTGIYPVPDAMVRDVRVRNLSGREFKRHTVKLALLVTDEAIEEKYDVTYEIFL